VRENYKLYFRSYGGIAYKYVWTSHDPILQSIASRSILFNASETCILAAVLTENSACLDWDNLATYAAYRNATVHSSQAASVIIKVTDSFISDVYIVLLFRKDSPIRTVFDRFVLKVMDSGLYGKWKNDYLNGVKTGGVRWIKSQSDTPVVRKLTSIFKEVTTIEKALTLRSFYGIIALLNISILFSIVLFLAEMCSPAFLFLWYYLDKASIPQGQISVKKSTSAFRNQ